MTTTETEPTPIQKLTRDLATSAKTLGKDEARFLVDAYYSMQQQRIRTGNQIRALTESQEPHEILRWLNDQTDTLEAQIKRALGKYAEGSVVGRWALSQYGIGPVLTAGLLAHIDIEKAPTVGHIWRFAGLDPTSHWDKGQKRPWNAALKTLCWKIGESFVKFKGKDECFYGKLYEQRRAREGEKNDRCEFAAQAEATLKGNPKHAQAEIYKLGKLPDGRLHLRAQRYSTKIFLSHLHHVWYRDHFNKEPPFPYAIAQMGHAHMIEVPHP